MAAQDATFPQVDPFEIGINEAFNQMIFCLNQRREAVLTTYRYLNEAKRQRPQNDVIHSHIVFHIDTVLLEQLIKELGNVFEEVLTLPNYVTMKPVEAVGKVGKRGKVEGQLFAPHAVAVDPNNRIFVTEGNASESHARISEFSERGECLSSFTPQDMIEPWGLATHGDYLYVTDTKLDAIFQYKMDAQFSLVTKQGTRGSLIGHFNSPRNLTVSTSGNVYVADCKNDRVQILNSSLQYLRTLNKGLIKSPCDIKLTADEVYVLCEDNPCLHVLSHAGVRKRSLLSSGYQMQMTEPLFFCLDAEENIIVSDNSAHRIKIFSKEGNLKKTVGEEGHQSGMLYHPAGLALTKELSLVVVSNNNNFAFQVFSSQ